MAYRLHSATHQLKFYKHILTLRNLDIYIVVCLKAIPVFGHNRLRCYANDQLRRRVTKGMGAEMVNYERGGRADICQFPKYVLTFLEI
jgi:hypothetical protein